jgi:hypothetical protein
MMESAAEASWAVSKGVSMAEGEGMNHLPPVYPLLRYTSPTVHSTILVEEELAQTEVHCGGKYHH